MPHPLMWNYLEQAGLWYAANIQLFDYDNTLISALVERWQLETHTFHSPYGECMVMLQDVTFQLGLWVDEEPVSDCTSNYLFEL